MCLQDALKASVGTIEVAGAVFVASPVLPAFTEVTDMEVKFLSIFFPRELRVGQLIAKSGC